MICFLREMQDFAVGLEFVGLEDVERGVFVLKKVMVGGMVVV